MDEWSTATTELDDRIGGSRGDSAVVVAIPGHLHVALVTPTSSPAVLDEPVVAILRVGSIADEQNSVIELRRGALLLVVDTFLVHLERPVACIDGDGNGALRGYGDLELLLVVRRQIHEAIVICTDILLLEVASSIMSHIRIAVLSVDSVILLDVVERVVHEPALTAMIAIGRRAVNQILLGQGDHLAEFSHVLSLQSACRRECPAAAAHALILHVRHEAVISPVHILGHISVEWNEESGGIFAVAVSIRTTEAIQFLVLVIGQVRDVIEPHFEGGLAHFVSLVVLLDLDEVLDEGLHVADLFLFIVALVELFLEIIPLGQGHINFLLNGRLRANSR